MKVEAYLKNLRIAPRKVRLVTHSLVGVDTREALLQLEKQPKKSALPVATLVKSAIANATNNFGLDENNLYIREISVGDGMRLKRFQPRAMGRAFPILRRSAHVRVILEERVEGKNRVTPKARAPKKAEKPEETTAEKPKTANTLPVQTPKVTQKAAPKAPGKVVKKVFQRKAT